MLRQPAQITSWLLLLGEYTASCSQRHRVMQTWWNIPGSVWVEWEKERTERVSNLKKTKFDFYYTRGPIIISPFQYLRGFLEIVGRYQGTQIDRVPPRRARTMYQGLGYSLPRRHWLNPSCISPLPPSLLSYFSYQNIQKQKCKKKKKNLSFKKMYSKFLYFNVFLLMFVFYFRQHCIQGTTEFVQ